MSTALPSRERELDLARRWRDDGEDQWQDFLAGQRPTPEESVTLARDGRTEQLGQMLGIRKERVRQVEHRALEKPKISVLPRSDQPQRIVAWRPPGRRRGAMPQGHRAVEASLRR